MVDISYEYILSYMSIFSDKSNDDLNKERIDKIDGLKYYNNFLTIDEEKYLLNYLSNIEFIFGIRYFGFNYTYKLTKGNVNDYLGSIPTELNIILSKLNIGYNQLVIEKINIDSRKEYKFNTHSKLFGDNFTTISIGGDYVANFNDSLMDDSYDILVKRRSLFTIGGYCRNYYTYNVSKNKKDIFNDSYVVKKNRYVLTFKNVNIDNPLDDSDNYYFSF